VNYAFLMNALAEFHDVHQYVLSSHHDLESQTTGHGSLSNRSSDSALNLEVKSGKIHHAGKYFRHRLCSLLLRTSRDPSITYSKHILHCPRLHVSY